MKTRLYRDSDWPALLRMTATLLHEEHPDDLADGMRSFLRRDDAALFVAEQDGNVVGYIQVAERRYADGCSTSPVGFIEEWFVEAAVRRRGIGQQLVAAAEQWARSRGISEMASDSLLDNTTSHRAHAKAGYKEVERAVRFRKSIA